MLALTESVRFGKALCAAVVIGDIQIVMHLIKHGACVNSVYDSPSKKNRTSPHLAVENSFEEMYMMLLKNRTNTDAKDRYGNTPLHLVVLERCNKIGEHLINHATRVDYVYDSSWIKGYYPLHLAVQKGSEEIVLILLKSNANCNARGRDGEMPLHLAVLGGHIKIIEHLVKHGACVDSVYDSLSKKCCTALHLAVENNSKEILLLLLKSHANINAKDRYGETPLHLAASNGNEEIVMILLKNHANCNAEGKAGETPLHLAVLGGNIKIVEHLINHGSCINSVYNCGWRKGCTPLHLAAEKSSEEIVLILLKSHANVNAKDGDGETALHLAVLGGNIKIVKHLIKHGACINSVYDSGRRKGRTSLHLAALKGSEEIVIVLLKNRGNFNAKDKHGKTPLHLAVLRRHIKIIEHILKHGACVDSVYDSPLRKYRTPLQLAAKIGDENIVKILLLYGANVKVKTIDGITAWDIAAQKGHTEIVKALSKCSDEVQCMKSEKIGNSAVSFYDILTKSSQHLAQYTMNKNIVQVLRSDDYKKKFPLYASMINSKFEKGMKRRMLILQAAELFPLTGIFHKLPINLTEDIFSYLRDEDFKLFINAYKSC